MKQQLTEYFEYIKTIYINEFRKYMTEETFNKINGFHDVIELDAEREFKIIQNDKITFNLDLETYIEENKLKDIASMSDLDENSKRYVQYLLDNAHNIYELVKNHLLYQIIIYFTQTKDDVISLGTAKIICDKLVQKYKLPYEDIIPSKEKEIASYEDAQKKTEHLETIKKLKSAREKYYEIEDKYQHIDITFFDNYLGSYLDAKEIRALDDADGKSRFTSRTSPSQMIMTHRLRYIAKDEQAKEGEAKYIFYVSGTNYSTHYSQSGQYQVFSEKEFLGQVKINSPFLGGFFSFVSSVWGLLILIMIPALYLIITSGRDLIKSLKEKEEQEEAYAQYGISSTSLEGISKEDQERLKAEMLEEILYGKKDETKQEVVKETKEENPALEGISKEDQERLKAEMLAEMLNEKK